MENTKKLVSGPMLSINPIEEIVAFVDHEDRPKNNSNRYCAVVF
jgi:hypothetical protein